MLQFLELSFARSREQEDPNQHHLRHGATSVRAARKALQAMRHEKIMKRPISCVKMALLQRDRCTRREYRTLNTE